jgi:hypothetical protein
MTTSPSSSHPKRESMKLSSSLLLLAATALSVPTQAQIPAKFTARVIKVASGACDPTATHQLACVDGVLLKSSTVNLATFENKLTLIEGTVAVGACVTIDVTAASNPQYTHTATSNNQFRLGANVSLRGTGPFASLVALALSASPGGFLPFDPYGAFMLHVPTTLFIDFQLALLGSYTWTIPIPNDVSLVGAAIQSQTGWVVVIGTPTGALVNAECFTIQR